MLKIRSETGTLLKTFKNFQTSKPLSKLSFIMVATRTNALKSTLSACHQQVVEIAQRKIKLAKCLKQATRIARRKLRKQKKDAMLVKIYLKSAKQVARISKQKQAEVSKIARAARKAEAARRKAERDAAKAEKALLQAEQKTIRDKEACFELMTKKANEQLVEIRFQAEKGGKMISGLFVPFGTKALKVGEYWNGIYFNAACSVFFIRKGKWTMSDC